MRVEGTQCLDIAPKPSIEAGERKVGSVEPGDFEVIMSGWDGAAHTRTRSINSLRCQGPVQLWGRKRQL